MEKWLNNNFVKVVFLLMMSVLIYFTFYDYIYLNENRIEYNLRSITQENNQQTNIAVTEKLNDQICILESYATLISEEDDITSDAAFQKLKPLLHTEMFSRIAVTNAEGISYTSDHFQHDSSKREYYIEGKKGHNYISNMMTSAVDQKEVVIMSVPVYQNRTFVGVLRATMNIAELNEYFELSFLSGSVSSYLIQSDGLNLISTEDIDTNFFQLLENNHNDSQMINEMKDNFKQDKKGSIVFQLAGKTRYAYYSPIAQTDWFMLTVLPHATVQQEMDNNLHQTVLLAVKIGIILLITCLYFFYLQYLGANAVKKMNKRMNAIISNTPGSSYKHDIDKPETIVFFKQNKKLLVGYTKEEILALIQKDIYALIFEEDYLALQNSLQDLKPNIVISNTYRIKDKENQIQWIFDQRQIIQEGNQFKYYVEVLDITELKNVQEQLIVSEERYKMILKETESVVFEWDTYTDKITFSELWMNKYGYSNELNDFLVFTYEYFHDQTHTYIPLLEAMVAGKVESDQVECVLPKANGEEVWVKIFAKAIFNEQGYLIRIVGSISDISQEKQKSLQLLERAQKDGLTKTYNRMTFENMIMQEIQNHSEESYIMFVIDIDNFKMINDTLGHASGDEALIKFSSILMSTFRENDIIGRLGGDEFVVFMRCPQQYIDELIEKKCYTFLSSISHICLTKCDTYHMNCSIGIAIFPQDGRNYQELFECADKRLYQAKKAGKNTYIYQDKK